MRFDIVTIFPEYFESVFAHGIVRRALKDGLATVETCDLRGFANDRHRTVDDRPFGGGEGMVLKPEPLAAALAALGVKSREQATPASKDRSLATPTGNEGTREQETGTRVILLSAQGKVFTQAMARELAQLERVVLICGRYEGVDERINELYCDMELSIGDYVLSGGEAAAAVVVDATVRLIPGVLGNADSGVYESFGAPDSEIAPEIGAAEVGSSRLGVPRSQHGAGGLLDYPHYTRPAEFQGLRAPEVLLNGDHAQIRSWRRGQQLLKTLKNRPDLLERAVLSAEDRQMLEALQRAKG